MIEKQIVIDLIEKIKSGIRKEIDSNNVEMALELIYNCANILYQTNIYYVDDELESDLKEISDIMSLSHFESCNHDTLIFYDGFGLNNRGLAQIYLNALCKMRNVIYVTYEDRKDSIPDLLNIIESGDNCKSAFIKRNNCGFKEQISKLNDLIFTEQPAEFFFYSMPNDVVATVIMNSYNRILKRYQVNLTDHAFWLGARCIDKCIEFRDYGASISYYYRNIGKDKLVKLPFYPNINKNIEFQGYPFKLENNQKIIFSGGTLYKTLGGDNKYYKIVEYILDTYKNIVFWYAGSGDDRELIKIKNKYPERVYHTEERKDLFQVLEHSLFYLSTYPICGGLMYQFAASAGKVPITLKYDDGTEGFLLNQDNIGIEFHDLKSLYDEVDKMISSESYLKERNNLMKLSVLNEEKFNRFLQAILNNAQNDYLQITYKKFNTESFRDEYLNRINMVDIKMMIANKSTIKSSIKNMPHMFFGGGLLKVIKKIKQKFQ